MVEDASFEQGSGQFEQSFENLWSVAYEASHKYTQFHTFYYFSTLYVYMYPTQRGLYARRGSVNHTY
jgi:hypothetical protein